MDKGTARTVKTVVGEEGGNFPHTPETEVRAGHSYEEGTYEHPWGPGKDCFVQSVSTIKCLLRGDKAALDACSQAGFPKVLVETSRSDSPRAWDK